MSYRVINIQTVYFSPSPETENMEFSYPCSRPPLSDSTRSPAFNLVPLQMSGRQRASSVTAIDQALFSSAAPMDEVSQGPRQSRTSQLALTGSPQKMPSLSTQPMSFTHIIITTCQRGESGELWCPEGMPLQMPVGGGRWCDMMAAIALYSDDDEARCLSGWQERWRREGSARLWEGEFMWKIHICLISSRPGLPDTAHGI